MPLYKYRAADRAGKADEILIEGDSQADSLNRLRQRGYTPIRFLGQVSGNAGDGGMLSRKGFDICAFTERLVPLLRSHIQLERALGILAETADSDHSRNVIIELRRGLHEGKKFSALVRDRSQYFPAFYANMVEAGEESGSMPLVLAELQKFLTERRRLREFLIASSIYPLIVLLVTGSVVILLVTVFIPKFSTIFTASGRSMPLPTEIMLGISQLITRLWWLWLLLLAGAALFFQRVRRGGKAKEWLDRMTLRIPLLGELIAQVEITRYLRTLAVLTQNYVHLLDSVGIAGRVFQNGLVHRSLAGVPAELRAGTRLSAAMSKSEYIPKTAVQMVSIGEETGNLGEMLQQTADYYEEGIRDRVRRLLALFEPAVILILALIVLMVVSSVFFAIVELNKM